MGFQHLHVHSRYSFLDGLNSSEELVKEAAEKGFSALGLTDHGNCSGWIEHYKACKEHKIKPVLGVEAYFVDDLLNPKRGEIKYHVCLFAMNNDGVKEIFQLMTRANEHFSFRPRIDLSMLMELKNVIVTAACGWRGIQSHGNYVGIAQRLRRAIGDRFYLEIMPIGEEFQRLANRRAIELVFEGYPIIATNDVHYTKGGESEYHNFLLRMNTKGRIKNETEGFYIRSEQEMLDAFHKHCPEVSYKILRQAFDTTEALAERIDIKLDRKEIILPQLHANGLEYISNRCADVLCDPRFKGKTFREYRDRMDMELSVIEEKGFADYFVLITDLCDYMRKSGFEMSVGRGSSGGSLVCYFLGITDLDPIKYDLLFERFLNRERSDWPDIDIDVEDERRDELLTYLKEKYGDNQAANISTYSELKPRSAFKDVSKSVDFGITHQKADQITKYFDNESSIREQVGKNAVLAEKVAELNKIDKIIEYSDAITGCYRQPGKHAAGIVISPEPLENLSILEKRGDNKVVNWDLADADYQGLVKADILGLRTSTIIAEAKRIIWDRRKEDVDWGNYSGRLKIDTPEVLDWFSRGWTTGVFQFESFLQQGLLKQLSPIKTIDTLIACNALGRPGPLDSGMTADYIKSYHGKAVTRPPYYKFIKDIVKDTYGVIIYQEQIIRLLQELAGYTVSKADSVRRVIAKSKGVEEFQKHREEFQEGCFKTSKMDKATSLNLFNDLQFFSRYSFNKSHAAAYTITAVRQMYLKVKYPLEYMCALFRKTEMSKTDKIRAFIKECGRLNINIQNPSINHSGEWFDIDGDKLVVGLLSIKGVGEKAVKKIMSQRVQRKYKNIEDFWIRTRKGGNESIEKVNIGATKALIMAGAFEEFNINQKVLVNNIEWLNYLIKPKKKDPKNWVPDGLYEKKNDFTDDEKRTNLLKLLPGIARIDIGTGLKIDELKLDKFQKMIKNCKACSLHQHYNSPVPFTYEHDSKIMVVSDYPRLAEVKTGEQMKGMMGKMFDATFGRIGIRRSDLYLTSVYHCRPLDNKLVPTSPVTCFKILLKEIEFVQPKLIIGLGNQVLKFFTGKDTGIMKLNSTIENYLIGDKFYTVFWMLHPASVRDEDKERLWKESLNELKRILDQEEKSLNELKRILDQEERRKKCRTCS